MCIALRLACPRLLAVVETLHAMESSHIYAMHKKQRRGLFM